MKKRVNVHGTAGQPETLAWQTGAYACACLCLCLYLFFSLSLCLSVSVSVSVFLATQSLSLSLSLSGVADRTACRPGKQAVAAAALWYAPRTGSTLGVVLCHIFACGQTPLPVAPAAPGRRPAVTTMTRHD